MKSFVKNTILVKTSHNFLESTIFANGDHWKNIKVSLYNFVSSLATNTVGGAAFPPMQAWKTRSNYIFNGVVN